MTRMIIHSVLLIVQCCYDVIIVIMELTDDQGWFLGAIMCVA